MYTLNIVNTVIFHPSVYKFQIDFIQLLGTKKQIAICTKSQIIFNGFLDNLPYFTIYYMHALSSPSEFISVNNPPCIDCAHGNSLT